MTPERLEMNLSTRAALLASVILAGCGNEPPPLPEGYEAPRTVVVPQDEFWAELTAICGNAYTGSVVESEPPDEAMSSATLVMHVRECSDTLIRVPFHVGEDRSRTWVFTRTATGLRLKHDHRHEDGTEDEVTQYGGDTAGEGEAHLQEFAADEHTATLIPAAARNVWTVEIHPGATFVYGLRREGTDRLFRAEFEIGVPVAAPPPPWGS
jgi:hypothetical protein